MKKLTCFVTMCALPLAFIAGCSEHQKAEKKVEIKTPGGSTTITTEQDIKKTGDHKDK